jgi:hypothetical protein
MRYNHLNSGAVEDCLKKENEGEIHDEKADRVNLRNGTGNGTVCCSGNG